MWPPERQRDGGIDEVPLPAGPGRLSLCGKHVVGPDPEAALQRAGASVIVCLNEADELIDRYPLYLRWLAAHEPRRALWRPIPDLCAPRRDEAVELVGELGERLAAGEHLLVHCGAGFGRSGTLAVAVLMAQGLALGSALEQVARARPLAGPEAGAQRDLLHALAGAP